LRFASLTLDRVNAPCYSTNRAEDAEPGLKELEMTSILEETKNRRASAIGAEAELHARHKEEIRTWGPGNEEAKERRISEKEEAGREVSYWTRMVSALVAMQTACALVEELR
jgi:long-subunit acyl-CoA synthetase (AMP-forming)